MERPKKITDKQIKDGSMLDAWVGSSANYGAGHNQCCTGYDLWLKEKLEGLEGVIRQKLEWFVSHIDKNGAVEWEDGTKIKYIGLPSLTTDLASAIRGHFNEKD